MNCVALFPAIPIQSTSPMSALNIPTLLVCVFPPPPSKSLIIFGRVQCFRIVWDTTYFGRHRANWYAVAAIAVLFAYSPAMALMPAAIATKRSTRRKKTIKSAVNASPPLAASRLQARYRRLRDIERPRYIGLRVSVSEALEGFLPLVRC
jgi:hypothetical protein